jgi:hypothetical protein
MKEIKLTKGEITLVDDDVYKYLNHWKWRYDKGGVKSIIKKHHVSMHRLVLRAIKGQEVDHINGNPLDNRRSNLRFCTTSQNHANLKKQSNNTSGFKGVVWCKDKNKWKAQITCQHRHFFLGYFNSPEKAAIAYDKKALKLFGEFSNTNF